MHLIATAGHVDHGKSTLVEAITGARADRLDEERRRGLTIELGFTLARLPSGRSVSVVDVPGHVRFLGNMLAGVGAVDACLLVVAATEGWKPQSEEHLRVLEILGVTQGIIALTKTCAAGPARTAEVREDVCRRLAASPLASAPVLEVDAPAGVGVEALLDALDRLSSVLADAEDNGRPRLWLDRVFSMRGAGTVVTGALAGGCLEVGDALVVVPGDAPAFAPVPVRVRALEVHGTAVGCAGPAGRVAVNLSGPGARGLRRGQALVRAGQWASVTTVDASIELLESLGHTVTMRGAFQLHVGSRQVPVRVKLLGERTEIEPGAAAALRVWLPLPLPLMVGDRYVLRDAGRSETVGGGRLLDVSPVRRARAAAPDGTTLRLVAERGCVEAKLLEMWTGQVVDPALVTGGRWVLSPEARGQAEDRLRHALAGSGPAGLELSLLDDLERSLVSALPGVTVSRGRARQAGATTGTGPGARDPGVAAWIESLEEQPFSPVPPGEAGITGTALREAVRAGDVVSSGGCYFAAAALEEAARRLTGLFAARPDCEGVTVSEMRQLFGTSRKFAIPLLEELDARGLTRRRGDVRIAGPQLAGCDR